MCLIILRGWLLKGSSLFNLLKVNQFSTYPLFHCVPVYHGNLLMITIKRQKQSVIAVLRLATLLKKRLGHRCFPVNLVSFIEQLQWVPLERKGTAQKMKFSIKDFFSKCDKIRRNLRIWSHIQKKSLMENFNFCAVGEHWYKMS